MMRRRSIGGSLGAATVAVLGIGTARAAPAVHRIVLHVGGGDPAVMSEALHNIANAVDTYAGRGETVSIELVANGPGYAMLRDTSPVAAGVAAVMKRYPFVVFAACQKSRAGFAAAEGKKPADIGELPGVTDVPAGVVRLAELQEAGFSYIRV